VKKGNEMNGFIKLVRGLVFFVNAPSELEVCGFYFMPFEGKVKKVFIILQPKYVEIIHEFDGIFF